MNYLINQLMTVDKAFYRHYLEMLLTLNRIHALTPWQIWLSRTQCSGDWAVLLLSYGFIDKQRPKAVQETMRHFIIHYRTPMQEPFARTACRAEIVVVERA